MIAGACRHAVEAIDALIARCLRDDPSSAVREIELGGLWEYVASRAWQCGAGGLLIDHLRRRGIEPPSFAEEQLDAYREHVAAANTYLLECARPALVALQQASVPFLVLKGAALHATVYDEIGVRPMVDVDVLVHPDNAARADHALRQAGFSAGAALMRADFYPRYHHEREYVSAGEPPAKIDLHVRPFRPLRYARTIPEEAFWLNPVSIRAGGLDVEMPDATNMLIHLAVHAACHGFSELRWLYDIRRWTQRHEARIDTGELAERSEQWGLALPVERALRRVRETLAPDDGRLTEMIEKVSRPARLVDRIVLTQTPHDAHRPVRHVLVNVLSTPGLRFRWGYLAAMLIPDRGHLGQIYHRRHPGWIAVAHVVRVARGVVRPFVPAGPSAT